MTDQENTTAPTQTPAQESTRPLDLGELTSGIRVRPAQLARMCGVSKQAVSGWIRRGLITLGPDGRVDPTKAARDLVTRSDPGRLRARVFRDIVDDVGALRRRISDLEAKSRDLQEQVTHLDRVRRAQATCEALLVKLLLASEADLRATPGAAGWRDMIEALRDEAAMSVAGTGPAPYVFDEGEGTDFD